MTEAELVDALALRTGTSSAQAAAMLDALADLAREARRRGDTLPLERFGAFCSEACRTWAESVGMPLTASPEARADPLKWQPEEADVEALLRSAKTHPLGLEFLVKGELGAVAALFRTHAFTVEAARKRVASMERIS